MRLTQLIGPVGAALLILASGCARKPAPRARDVRPEVVRDVPAALRGTVGSEAILTGRAQPILVSGFGLVVGLPGTGGGDLPQRIAATMERQLGQLGLTRANEGLKGGAFEGKTPSEVLRMKEVAVVIVYAAVVPGAPNGTHFDVYVTSVNKGTEISLEGGLLYSTDLHPGPPATFGAVKTKPIAVARGPVFINPFSQPGASEGYSRQDGRILGGGTVENSMNLELVLDNESHSRATSITSAINNRFPAHPGGEPTARGKTSRLIHVTVPPSYRDDAEAFIQTLLHIQIQQGQPQEFARRYVTAMKAQPILADDLSWCLQALPQKAAVPFLRDLYDSTEMGIRMAALRAGAALGDALAAPTLKQMAKDSPAVVRSEALRLLGRLSAGPTVDSTLREQLDAKELSVRVAAYESLVQRAEAVEMRRFQEQLRSMPPAVRIAKVNDDPTTTPQILELTGDTLQGVTRKVIEDKFILDVVPSGEPLIYVTQRGRPRIVLFGQNIEVTRPAVVSAWSDRLMLASESATDDLRVYYKTADRIDVLGETIPGIAAAGKAPVELPKLVEFLAHTPSVEDPRPGLSLTYSEVVGALYAFHKGRAIPAAYAVEEDFEQARLLAESREAPVPERPDTRKDAEANLRIYEAPKTAATRPAEPKADEPMVVPLPPPTKKK